MKLKIKQLMADKVTHWTLPGPDYAGEPGIAILLVELPEGTPCVFAGYPNSPECAGRVWQPYNQEGGPEPICWVHIHHNGWSMPTLLMNHAPWCPWPVTIDG